MAEKLQTISEITALCHRNAETLWPAEEADGHGLSHHQGIYRHGRRPPAGLRRPVADPDAAERIIWQQPAGLPGRATAVYLRLYPLLRSPYRGGAGGTDTRGRRQRRWYRLIISENPGFTGTAVDLCTGSACIAIALSAGLPGCNSRCHG